MAAMPLPRIREVRALCAAPTAAATHGGDCHDVTDKHWINGNPLPIANPMSGHPQYKQFRKSWGINALGSVVVEVESECGEVGVGVTIGGEPAAYIVEKHLSRFVEGQFPSAVELIHDQMMRATLNYGRKGLAVQALSAVDLAIWDLLGKLRKSPVFELLGGPVREVLPVYCTSSRPDVSQKLGFVGGKVPLPYGPSDGDPGLRKNVETIKAYRESVGPDFPLSVDCYMALTPAYTVKLCRELAPYNVKWVEEFLPPDQYDGYVDVYRKVNGDVLLTTGEHEYGLAGYQQLLKENCIDILQPDVTWVGGITECKKIIALAAAHGKLVIPHGSSVYSYHLQLAFINTPVAEFINLHPTSEDIVPYLGALFTDEPLPQNGRILASDLAKRAGFGVTLKKDGLHRPYTRTAAEVQRQFDANAAPVLDAGTKEIWMPF